MELHRFVKIQNKVNAGWLTTAVSESSKQAKLQPHIKSIYSYSYFIRAVE